MLRANKKEVEGRGQLELTVEAIQIVLLIRIVISHHGPLWAVDLVSLRIVRALPPLKLVRIEKSSGHFSEFQCRFDLEFQCGTL